MMRGVQWGPHKPKAGCMACRDAFAQIAAAWAADEPMDRGDSAAMYDAFRAFSERRSMIHFDMNHLPSASLDA